MPQDNPIAYVDTDASLDALCRALDGHPWLALDTEFIREDTYYPRPCLLQVATPDVTACIDTIALSSPTPLFTHLDDTTVTKVLHAGHQDMEIFTCLRQGHLPAPIFDTQIAAALLGWPGQSSYATLVRDVLDVALDKGHARTDWSRRPLSPEQLEYAADDVRYLGPLYLELERRLVAQGRLAWLHEDCAALSDPSRYDNPPEQAWRRVRGIRYLTPPQQAILCALTAWRETTARDRNRPRGWILRDDVLLEIARRAPRQQEQLQEVPAIPRKALERHGKTLIEIVRDARVGDDSDPGEIISLDPGPPTAAEKSLLKRMTQLVRSRATELSIDPGAIAARRDLVDLMQGRPPAQLMQGWRRDVIGSELIRLAAA